MYSSHILSDVFKICNRVGFVKNGNLLKVIEKNQLQQNGKIVTIKCNNNNILKDLKVSDYKFKWNKDINQLIKILSKYEIDELLIENMKMEDLFLEYYEECNND